MVQVDAPLNNQRILVTGATGFVGRHLCRRLQKAGAIVRRALRSAESVKADSVKADSVKANTCKVNPSDQFEDFIVGPIDRSTDWSAALTDVDQVIHLAARVHVMNETETNPAALYYETNAFGTEHLAQQAKALGVKRFVFLSSIKVNGEETTGTAFSESDPPTPMDDYGRSKYLGEQALIKLRDPRFAITILRTPLVYGPGVRANFYSLMKAVDRGTPIPLSREENRRSFTYIENLVDAIVSIAIKPSLPEACYLVSDGSALSTRELLESIGQCLGKSPRIIWLPRWTLRFFSVFPGIERILSRLTHSLEVDSIKLQKDLNWSPPNTALEGLRATSAWYQQNSNTTKI